MNPAQHRRMASELHPGPNRPLIDAEALEEAGRALRQWMDQLLGRGEIAGDTEIAWESGEPDDVSGPPG